MLAYYWYILSAPVTQVTHVGYDYNPYSPAVGSTAQNRETGHIRAGHIIKKHSFFIKNVEFRISYFFVPGFRFCDQNV